MATPAWQTDDLADEWVEEEDMDAEVARRKEEDGLDHGTAAAAIVEDEGSNGTCNFGTANFQATEAVEHDETGGTFVVRSDLPPPALPQAPGVKKSGMKNMFSPLQLERMFEPPSPPKASLQLVVQEGSPPVPFRRVASRPVVPSKLSQVVKAASVTEEETEAEVTEVEGCRTPPSDVSLILEEDRENLFGKGGAKSACEFTFKVPLGLTTINGVDQRATSPLTIHDHYKLPILNAGPIAHPNDPRLRLFQLQYDTYTRDHLSAIVDSFAISTPSDRTSSGSTMLATTPESQKDIDDLKSSQRATKRLKLTPPVILPAVCSPPRVQSIRPPFRRDYVGESQAFMQRIKQARDFSLYSIGNATEAEQAPPTPRPQRQNNPQSQTAGAGSSSDGGDSRFSSMAYRKQAADLMAKIKGDRRRTSDGSDSSIASSKNDPASPDRSMAPSPPSIRPSSPVKRRLVAKDDDPDPDPEADPPSYAASVGRSYVGAPNGEDGATAVEERQRAARPTIQPPVVMPVVVPTAASPRSADRVRSPNPAFLAPPSGPFGSGHFPNHLRTESTQEDLNRLVSVGSSLTSGTSLTIGSAGSNVKHAGPVQMVRIKPGDLPTLPERVGSMVFDRALGRWIKERGVSRMTIAQSSVNVSPHGSPANTDGTSESEDPFRDIDSTREEASSRSVAAQDVSGYTVGDLRPNLDADRSGGTEEMDLVSSNSISLLDERERSIMDDREKSFLSDRDKSYISSFSFDQPSADVADLMTGEKDRSNIVQDDILTDSDDDYVREMAPAPSPDDEEDEFVEKFASLSMHQLQLHHAGEISFSMSMEASAIWQDDGPASAVATPRPASKRAIQPPRSALKSASVTPISRPGQGRSVSFSDGRTDGKIKGLLSESEDSTNKGPAIASLRSFQSAPSVRTKRITDMLGSLEESFLEDDLEPFFAQGPSRPMTETAPVLPNNSDSPNGSTVSQRPFVRSRTLRRPGQSSPRRGDGSSQANGTFLTECSFGVAHDRLVQVITDVQPFEPYWESLTSVNLSNRKLDSVARLKEFLPSLDTLNLNNNLLSWLSGIPGSVRTLTAASNALSSLTSFAHLQHIEILDVSNNDIDSLKNLQCLRHLRELRADNNKIAKLDGILQLDGLVKLSLEGNELQIIDLTSSRWNRLELLNLSNNKLDEVLGLKKLASLASLNLDNNLLCTLDDGQKSESHSKKTSSEGPMLSRLRVLRLSGNRLKHLDAARFPNLRTLYVDNNFLAEVSSREQGAQAHSSRLMNLHRLSKLENFSARNQNGPASRDLSMLLECKDIRDVKRLYLSGNSSPLPLGSFSEACYNLVYLELAACRLTTLPANFSQLLPNVRALNLNYNFLEADEVARSLVGLTRLTKLTIVGNRLSGTKPLVKMLVSMGSNIEMIDFRMNPCTLGWYLPLLVQEKDAGALLQPSEAPRGKGVSAFHSNPVPGSYNALQEGDLSLDGASFDGGSGSDTAEGSVMSSKKTKRGPSHWETLDAQYRRGLPDKAYAGRLAYRGLVMRACPQIKMLDDVRVSEKEKKKAEGLLRRVLEEVEASNATIRPNGKS